MNADEWKELKRLRVGLLGLGLDAYWPQFEGLKERLQGYVAELGAMLQGQDRSVVNLGLVDSMDAAVVAGHRCRREDIDLLLIYATTYALSATVLPVVQRAGVPVVLLNLQPEATIGYDRIAQMKDRRAMTGEWLAYCGSCPVPEIANVLRRLNIPFYEVTGTLRRDADSRRAMQQWLQAAGAVKALAHSRMGLMGSYYGGMLDIATDLAQVSGRFGVQLQMLEVDELTSYRLEVSEKDATEKAAELSDHFNVQPDCGGSELLRAARTAVALDRMTAEHRLDLLAYYHKGTGVDANEDTMSSIILGTSLLTARGIAVAGEYEVKNALAMKLLGLLGVGGAFTEYYAMDFTDDVVLMGHDGPGHPAIAEEKLRVRPLDVYHGKVGRGLAVEMQVRLGPVTLLSVVEHRERGFQLLLAEGESVAGPILAIGNTNSRYRFSIGARGFVQSWNSHGPAHHCAIGVGHVGTVLKKVGALLDMPVVQVC